MIFENKPINILVVAPHHDDEVIGCGGSIAYLTRSGHQVDVAYMTAGYIGVPGEESSQAVNMREDEARLACEILGVKNIFFLRYPDRDLSYSLPIVKELIHILRNNQYTGILFPHQDEQDHDHRVTHEIAGEAAWLSMTSFFPDLGPEIDLKYQLLYEVWTPLSTYNIKVDISNYLDIKRLALSRYKSQFSEDQAARILGLNTYRAAMHSLSIKAVEIFKYYTR